MLTSNVTAIPRRTLQLPALLTLDPAFGEVASAAGFIDESVIYRSPYVALVAAIIGQRISYTQARKIRGAIYAQLGTSFGPADIERAVAVIPAAKLALIRRVNQYLGNNILTEYNIWQLNCLTGIGDWTINCALLACSNNPDIFLPDDLFIRQRLQRYFRLSQLPPPAMAAQLSERWKPHRSTAMWYLWRWF